MGSQTECVESKRAFSCIVFQQFTLKVLIFWWTGQMVGVYLMYRLSLEKQLQLVIRFYIFCRILIFTWRCFISELPSSLSLNFNLVYARILNMTESKYFHPVSHECPNFNYSVEFYWQNLFFLSRVCTFLNGLEISQNFIIVCYPSTLTSFCLVFLCTLTAFLPIVIIIHLLSFALYLWHSPDHGLWQLPILNDWHVCAKLLQIIIHIAAWVL